jgi:lipopolysaccharide/colanic/teichoic acid biosynthesis glycosyltransferase
MNLYLLWLAGALLGAASFGAAQAVYLYQNPSEIDLADQLTDIWPALAACVVVCALVTAVVGAQRSPYGSFLQHLRLTLGGALILQAILVYGLVLPGYVPLSVLAGGSLAASALFAWSVRWARRRGDKVLLLGYDERLVQLLTPERVLGVLAEREAEARGLPYAGRYADLPAAAERLRPVQVVVCGAAWPECDALAPHLLACIQRGVRVTSALRIYEESLGRLPLAYLEPTHLLQSPYFSMNRRLLMAQAVYGNLACLALLLAATPLLLLASILVAAAGGRGPVLDRTAYAGFQTVPFQMLRFRTRRADGEVSMAGRILRTFGLVNLPQLINVVRGEMTFLGPQPVRKDFADRMTELIPFYPLRFLAKPGWVGWAQANEGAHCTDVLLTLEYDLFYATEGSPDLELQILLQTFRFAGRRLTNESTRPWPGESGQVRAH